MDRRDLLRGFLGGLAAISAFCRSKEYQAAKQMATPGKSPETRGYLNSTTGEFDAFGPD
jgi:hypothetical protein